MTNLWEFLLQTAGVSLTAALLLLLKSILRDKLSPRWQYWVWSLLALRILLPVPVESSLLPRLGLWIETAKSAAEASLSSAYSGVYVPISPEHVLPMLRRMPASITDWLFVIYAAGAAVCALRYLFSYFLLRLRLRRGRPVSDAQYARIADIRLRHWLKPRTVVEVEGLESPFVCGILRPVLALPAGEPVDEKVLLHELLHLHYRDALQSVLWAALRCLHWCNPFLQYVFDRIGNDMESLCDQRVLERLEGEQRREYGMLLLSMVNRRYPRTPGTTSISNGGRNIARRIDSIARFKKYPRGMGLVGVCILLVLLSPVMTGTAAAYEPEDYRFSNTREAREAMALTRIRRCTTPAGAIDTYAKGILTQNGLYIATASPLSQQEALHRQMADSWYIPTGEGLEYLVPQDGYRIFDLVSDGSGGGFCYLAFRVTDFADPALQDWPTDINGVQIVDGTVILSLHIFTEGGSWVVRECDERIFANFRYDQLEYYDDYIPFLSKTEYKCATGTVTVALRSGFHIDNSTTANSLFGQTSFDTAIRPDARFSWVELSDRVIYRMDPDCPQPPQANAQLQAMALQTMDQEPELELVEDILPGGEYISVSGSTTLGFSYFSTVVGENWDGCLHLGGGESFTPEALLPFPELPAGYAIRILFDGRVAEEFRMEVNPRDNRH